MSVISGAWVRRATLQAADGAPMPTKQTSSLVSARAAAMVIISVGVKSFILASSCNLLRMLGEVFGACLHDVLVDPFQEGVAIAGDLVPSDVEGIGARIVCLLYTSDAADE